VPAWRLADSLLELTEPIGAGIVNVTTDSMFEGARSGTPERAIADGLRLAEAGFDMLDVGAVPARSGPPVAPAEEAARLVPAVEGLVARAGVPVSADTFEPEVATAAAAAGAAAINDIGGAADAMLEAVAEAGCGYVLMHIEGPPRVDRPRPAYDDVVERLKSWFGERIERALALGVAEEAIAIDPGLDFDLSTDDDLEILRRLGELHSLGRPIYCSLSRKDFIGAVLARSWEGRLGAGERGWGSVAATALAVDAGAQVHRIHDVAALDALRVAGRIRGAGRG
jgi:dihydropteroate synthase